MPEQAERSSGFAYARFLVPEQRRLVPTYCAHSGSQLSTPLLSIAEVDLFVLGTKVEHFLLAFDAEPYGRCGVGIVGVEVRVVEVGHAIERVARLEPERMHELVSPLPIEVVRGNF